MRGRGRHLRGGGCGLRRLRPNEQAHKADERQRALVHGSVDLLTTSLLLLLQSCRAAKSMRRRVQPRMLTEVAVRLLAVARPPLPRAGARCAGGPPALCALPAATEGLGRRSWRAAVQQPRAAASLLSGQAQCSRGHGPSWPWSPTIRAKRGTAVSERKAHCRCSPIVLATTRRRGQRPSVAAHSQRPLRCWSVTHRHCHCCGQAQCIDVALTAAGHRQSLASSRGSAPSSPEQAPAPAPPNSPSTACLPLPPSALPLSPADPDGEPPGEEKQPWAAGEAS